MYRGGSTRDTVLVASQSRPKGITCILCCADWKTGKDSQWDCFIFPRLFCSHGCS